MSHRTDRKAWKDKNRKNPLRKMSYSELVYPKRRKRSKVVVKTCKRCGEKFSTTPRSTLCPSCEAWKKG